MKLLRTINKLNDLAQHWHDVLTCSINMLNRHIGAMDGGFPCTEMPGDQVNQADYYSGHYQAYGLNVQAFFDLNLLFVRARRALYIPLKNKGGYGGKLITVKIPQMKRLRTKYIITYFLFTKVPYLPNLSR